MKVELYWWLIGTLLAFTDRDSSASVALAHSILLDYAQILDDRKYPFQSRDGLITPRVFLREPYKFKEKLAEENRYVPKDGCMDTEAFLAFADALIEGADKDSVGERILIVGLLQRLAMLVRVSPLASEMGKRNAFSLGYGLKGVHYWGLDRFYEEMSFVKELCRKRMRESGE